jgi:hypothetical protein
MQSFNFLDFTRFLIFYYSTGASRAEWQLFGSMERDLVKKNTSDWIGVSKIFASFKVPEKTQGFAKRNSQEIGICIHILIGFLPLLAYLILGSLTNLQV